LLSLAAENSAAETAEDAADQYKEKRPPVFLLLRLTGFSRRPFLFIRLPLSNDRGSSSESV
jgi:hypothetical protein